MKTQALFTMTIALGGLAFGGCATDAPADSKTRAMEQGLECNTQNGVATMKASLAVAMATELGQINPAYHLWNDNGMVRLTQQAKWQCEYRGYDYCPQTQSVLNMQGYEVNNHIDQNVFNATTFRNELVASFDRVKNKEEDLLRNNPDQAPGDHWLWSEGTSDYGACGIHFDFGVWSDKPVENLEHRMIFFGGDDNDFLDFRHWENRIAIDPTGTMESSVSTSDNMVYDICYGYNIGYLRQEPCVCNTNQGILRRADWDWKLTYCKY